MTRIVLAILALAASPLAARAAGGMVCESADGATRLSMIVGSLPVLSVVDARLEIDGAVFAMKPEEGATPVSVGQAAFTTGGLVVDFTDPNIEAIVASVRLAAATEGDEAAVGGVVTLPGEAARAVSCEGP